MAICVFGMNSSAWCITFIFRNSNAADIADDEVGTRNTDLCLHIFSP